MYLDDPRDPKGDLKQKTDEELLALAVQKPGVFSLLVDRYQEPFLRKARFMLQSDEEAEDLVQEAFVKIYLNGKRFRPVPGASFKSWGYKILINTCLSYLKKRGRERERTIELDPEIYEALPDKNERDEQRFLIDEALSILSRMPVALSEALRPTIIEGKTQSEVAKSLGVSPGALRTRIHRAKKEFKKIKLSMLR